MDKNVISLLPHNKKLFDEIMEAINNGEHSIFYSEATGLGKSFIFMRLVHDLFSNEGNKVLYIIPKNAIWENMQLYKEFKYIKDYVEVTTYADFNSIKFKHYNYDAIFIDECHHLTSDIQGTNIIKLCNEYVEANRYVFGFTATPENGRKRVNSDKYFSTKIYGMDIIDAIESGMFDKIQYAIADPDTIVDDKEYCKKYSIDSTKTLLENILNEYDYVNRWLVYFSNIKSLNKNLQSIKKLFPDYKIFIMHSRRLDNDEQFRKFNSYDGKCMLLTVSMILEGIHPKNVGGILLYRNVTVNTVLLQVLGRVCDINTKNSPICVDIMDSINNIPACTICEYVNDQIDKNNNTGKSGIKRKSIKSIIDIKASSYKYIELISHLRNIVKTYKNYTWINYSDLSNQLGFSRSYVGELLKDGKYNSCEEIIDAKLDGEIGKSNSGDYKGYQWDNYMDLSNKLGFKYNYVSILLNDSRYKSCEEIIDAKLDGRLVIKHVPNNSGEYRGYKWSSHVNLSSQLGFNKGHVGNLLREGKYKSCEEIIDAYLDGSLVRSYNGEYKGYKWESLTDLGKQLDISPAFISKILNNGRYNSCEEIIDAKLNGDIKIKNSKQNTGSYKGYTWKSLSHLSNQLGHGKSYITQLLSRGRYKSCEEIIDAKLNGKLK